jgi:hypothetical protein
MSDDPQKQSRAWIIGAPILMGIAIGLLVATRKPQSLESTVECAFLGLLTGLAVGVGIWFWRWPS